MAAEMKKALGIDAQLIPGSGGIFEVAVDGRTVYSKHEKGRFPEPGEVVKSLKK